MDRDFSEFPADMERLVRGYIAKECRLGEATDTQQTRLRGKRVKFYKNVWLGYIEDSAGERLYYLTRPRGQKGRLVPICNAIGSVDRANRLYRLELTKDSVADYLHFYFSFTPKEDPMLSRLSGRATQFAVPRNVADLVIDAGAAPGDAAEGASAESQCSDECLVRGAVWHFLDYVSHERVVPLRYKRKRLPLEKVTGRIPIQFRHAVFAVDFQVPLSTGVPVLSNEELLYQSDALKEPEVLSEACLTIPTRVAIIDFWSTARTQMRKFTAVFGQGLTRVLWWVLVVAALYFWGFGALFCAGEHYEVEWVRRQFELWADLLGEPDWTRIGYQWTTAAILTFLGFIVLTTHRDKVVNWLFRFCPKGAQPAVAKVLNYFVTRWDDALTAKNTFSKRLWWSAAHLAYWGAYLVAAFTSLQMLSDLMEGQAPRPALLVAETLMLQAGLNLPFVTFVLIQGWQVITRLDPVAEGILDYWPLAAFQGVMGLVVFGGLYRVWIFTVEASPYTFFRRLRKKPRDAPATQRQA